MYLLTDPLAGLEELILMVILGGILLLFGIGYIVYKLLNQTRPDPSLQKSETEAERKKPVRSLTNAVIIVLLFFVLVAIGWGVSRVRE
jgi:Na+/glutamate symporter